jgi:periplasmic protein TonB
MLLGALLILAAVAAPTGPAPAITVLNSTHVKPRSASPIGNTRDWVTTDDYPVKALNEGRGGEVRLRLTISETGQILNCVITNSSGSQDLDIAACDILTRRALFSPATDDRGRPTQGIYSFTFNWRIPEDLSPPALQSGLIVRSYIVDVDGSISL